MTRRHQGGFTLMELMAVVIIVGVLAGLAVAATQRDPKVDDVARGVAHAIAEAQRVAVAAGPVRADVKASTGVSARAQVRVTVIDGFEHVVVEKLVEDSAPATTATWVEAFHSVLGKSVTIAGYRETSALAPGSTPAAVIDDDGVEIQCRADGTCDPMTFYLEGDDERYRVVVLPLGGTPTAVPGW